MVGGEADEPWQEAAVFDQRLPLGGVPVHVFPAAAHARTGLPAQQHHHRVGLGGDEAEEEDILGAAVVAFEGGVAEGGGGVELHLLVACADKVVDDVRTTCVAACRAEPLAAGEALDDAARVVDAAVRAGRGRAARPLPRVRPALRLPRPLQRPCR